jgi:hypothetical protein
MRKPMIPAPPQARGSKKPKTEFEAFDALAGRLLNVPKTAIAPKKKPKKKTG